MLWQLTVEAVVELIAVDSVAIEIGATFSLVIVFAAIAFWLHERLLRRAVRLAEAARLVRDNKGPVLMAALVAGLVAGKGEK